MFCGNFAGVCFSVLLRNAPVASLPESLLVRVNVKQAISLWWAFFLGPPRRERHPSGWQKLTMFRGRGKSWKGENAMSHGKDGFDSTLYLVICWRIPPEEIWLIYLCPVVMSSCPSPVVPVANDADVVDQAGTELPVGGQIGPSTSGGSHGDALMQ